MNSNVISSFRHFAFVFSCLMDKNFNQIDEGTAPINLGNFKVLYLISDANKYSILDLIENTKLRVVKT